jgi:hypothetical protein
MARNMLRVVNRVLGCLHQIQSNSTEICTGNKSTERRTGFVYGGRDCSPGAGIRRRRGEESNRRWRRGDGAMTRGGGVRGCVRWKFIEAIGRFRDKLSFKSVLIPVPFVSSFLFLSDNSVFIVAASRHPPAS